MGWPLFTEDLAITASPVRSPPPSSGSREESTHSAEAALHDHQHRARHTHKRAGRQAGCGGIWEQCTRNVGEHCVSISLFRNVNSFPKPSCLYPVPQAASWPREREYLTGLLGPATQTRWCCAHATGLNWQRHLCSSTSQRLSLTFTCVIILQGSVKRPVDPWLKAGCQFMHLV